MLKLKLVILAMLFWSVSQAQFGQMIIHQIDTLLSSPNGDTLLYSNQASSKPTNDTIRYVITISTFNHSVDTSVTLSLFNITLLKNQSVYTQINADTVRKYNLHNYVLRCVIPTKNLVIKIKPHKLKLIEKGEKLGNLYSANVSILIKCKSNVIRDTKLNYLYLAKKERDFDPSDVCKVYVWKIMNTDRYFIHYSLKKTRILHINGNGMSGESFYVREI